MKNTLLMTLYTHTGYTFYTFNSFDTCLTHVLYKKKLFKLNTDVLCGEKMYFFCLYIHVKCFFFFKIRKYVFQRVSNSTNPRDHHRGSIRES